MTSRKFYFDPTAIGTAVFMGQTEARLMELVWQHDKLTVKKALFYLENNHPAYTTVMTVMSRLAKKGLLIKEKEGRNFIYRPAVSREHFLREKLQLVTTCLEKNFKNTL